MDASKKNLEKPVFLFVVLFVMAIAYLGYTKGVLVNDPWIIGDWLINYNAGFIRRGFIGQIAIYFAEPKIFVLALQVIFYSAISFFFVLSLKNRNYPVEFVLIAMTPFLFLFPLLDPQGGFRKEIIGIALVAISCWAKLSLKKEKRIVVCLLIFALFPILILTHELLVIFLPIIALLNLDIKFDRTQIIFLLLLIFASFIAFLLCAKFNTISPREVGLICEPLKDFCNKIPRKNGAITALQHSSEYGYERVVSTHFNAMSILRYLTAVTLILPIVYFTKNSFIKSVSGAVSKTLFLLFTIGLLSLHFVARDYGRFIHIWLFCYVLVSLSGAKISKEEFIKIKPGFLVLVFVYFPFWHINHLYTFSLSSIGGLIVAP